MTLQAPRLAAGFHWGRRILSRSRRKPPQVTRALDEAVTRAIGDSRSDLNPLQLVLYREHARRNWGAREILGFFDQDRRVNELGRLRKPAFQRRQVPLGEPVWRAALILLERAQRRITELEKGKTASSTSAFTKSMPSATTQFSTARHGAGSTIRVNAQPSTGLPSSRTP